MPWDYQLNLVHLVQAKIPGIQNMCQVVHQGEVQILCPHIKSINFKYWNHQMKTWEDEWRTEGMGGTHSDLPLRVLIEMWAIMENEVEQKFVTQTEIMITNPINIL